MKTEEAIFKWAAVIGGQGTLNNKDGVIAASLLLEEIERLREVEKRLEYAELKAKDAKLKFENFKMCIVGDVQKILNRY